VLLPLSALLQIATEPETIANGRDCQSQEKHVHHVKLVVVALAHSPDTGEESFLVQSAEDVGSNGLHDLSQLTTSSKQGDHQLLPSLVLNSQRRLALVAL
jgi:hypothetical protein